MGRLRETELQPLTSAVKRRPFLVVDIESKDGDSQRAGFTRPFMVGVYDGTTYTPFFDTDPRGAWQCRYWWPGGCVDRALRYLLQAQFCGHHIYAHNAGKFDYLFFLPWLARFGTQLGYQFRVVPVASSIQLIDVWRGRSGRDAMRRQRTWRLLDSYRLIPTGLDKAAKSFGLTGKLQHDLNLSEADPRWVEYNQVDCAQLYAVLTKFHDYVEHVLLGEVGVTAPATAMKLFRRRYLRGSVPRSIETHAFVREGYVGGRVEVLRLQGAGLHYYDINSSYPRAMLEPMPAGTAHTIEGTPAARFTDGSKIGFVRAEVTVPDQELPVLPVRMLEGSLKGKLVFATGRLRGVWEWSELQLAVERGARIDRMLESVWYEPVDLFGEYVRDLYEYRDPTSPKYQGPGLVQIVKIMLNASYGKFGQKQLRRELYLDDDPERPKSAVPLDGDPECSVWAAERMVDAPYIMPQIAARVTALARVQLYRAMQAALDRGGHVYYCDTDSVITDVELPTSTELGALKDEIPDHSGQLTGRFLGPKLYILEALGFERVKAKGLEQRTREAVERLAAGETLYQDRLEKIGTLARAGFSRGPRMVRVPRTLHGGDGKREVLSGGLTRPHRVQMW